MNEPQQPKFQVGDKIQCIIRKSDDMYWNKFPWGYLKTFMLAPMVVLKVDLTTGHYHFKDNWLLSIGEVDEWWVLADSPEGTWYRI